MLMKMAQKILGIQCRRCKGGHLTAKCPHKDHLPEVTERPVPITSTPEVSHTETTLTSTKKYIPPGKRSNAPTMPDQGERGRIH